MSDPVVELLESVWESIARLGANLSEEQWGTLTECPGWSVRDQVSHIIGLERMLAGESPEPAATEGGLEGIAAFNEGQIAPRRSRPGADVLAEMNHICARRLEMLRALPDEKWDEVGFTPIGDAPYRTFMHIRVFDCWVHEQDMRRALGISGHLSGPVVRHCLDWHARNMGYVVGKKAGAPDGATVVFDIEGDADGPRGVAVAGGRAKPTTPPDDPAVTVRCDVDTYNALCCGRTDPAAALADGLVTLSGDEELGERVVMALAYVS
ncbi:MAG: maleylpyruvate isomerase family mycothiol-dependent enzyme [bacterium]|nr:maleylpyruvate isomerase family mycothiol-dependent enzyme [bacterium]MDE0215832.1 maleylpyruvate isomerase family mycothiol-dependent enzyme [bacterium]